MEYQPYTIGDIIIERAAPEQTERLLEARKLSPCTAARVCLMTSGNQLDTSSVGEGALAVTERMPALVFGPEAGLQTTIRQLLFETSWHEVWLQVLKHKNEKLVETGDDALTVPPDVLEGLMEFLQFRKRTHLEVQEQMVGCTHGRSVTANAVPNQHAAEAMLSFELHFPM